MRKTIRTTKGIKELTFNECYELFERYRYKVFIYWDKKIYSINSDDLMQEIDIAFYKAYSIYDLEKSNNALFTTYSTTVINNEIKHLIVRNTRQKRYNECDELSLNEMLNEDIEIIDTLGSKTFEDDLISSLSIHKSINKLKGRHKEVIDLSIQEFNEAEIAEKLNISRQRVNQIKKTAREKILIMGWQ